MSNSYRLFHRRFELYVYKVAVPPFCRGGGGGWPAVGQFWCVYFFILDSGGPSVPGLSHWASKQHRAYQSGTRRYTAAACYIVMIGFYSTEEARVVLRRPSSSSRLLSWFVDFVRMLMDLVAGLEWGSGRDCQLFFVFFCVRERGVYRIGLGTPAQTACFLLLLFFTGVHSRCMIYFV